jgi:hypothetical protein
MPGARRSMKILCGLTAVLVSVGSANGQELEPRAYSPSPSGTSFLVVSATRSSGGVFTDASAPLTDVDAEVGILGLSIGHTFALLGRSAMVLGVVPVTWGQASGQIGEDRREASRRGLADPRVRLSMLFLGSPPATPEAFARRRRQPVLGASLTVVMPVGQYDSTKLVNLGSNRWSLKPEVGLSLPAGRWTFDGYAGVWWFTDNGAYYPGPSRRHQDPVIAVQGHVSYTLGRRAWIAANATWYGGGQMQVNDLPTADPYRNSRLGATWAIPLGMRQSLKISYSAGAATRVGADFKTISGAWQLVIF